MEFPAYIYYGFIALTLVYLFVLYSAFGKNIKFLVFSISWLAITATLAATGVYAITDMMPPLIFVSVWLFFGLGLFFIYSKTTQSQRANISLQRLHYYHTVRIFVETIFLYNLAKLGMVSDVMSFEGRNFDIIIGLSAPLIIWLYFYKAYISKTLLKAWNIIGFCILAFTVSQATLSAPWPLQQFSFEQPTAAILYFPMVWLPTFLAPAALLCHLLALKLMRERK